MSGEEKTTFRDTALRYYRAAVEEALVYTDRPELSEKVKILLKGQADEKREDLILETVRMFKQLGRKDGETIKVFKNLIRPIWSFLGDERQAKLLANIKRELNDENFKIDGG